MKNSIKKANILAFMLTAIFVLSFFNMAFSPFSSQSQSSGEEIEQNDDIENENGSGPTPTDDSQFDAPPKFVTALSAWRYAETKLYELAHWESLILDQKIDTQYAIAGQVVKIKKVWNGRQDAVIDVSTILAPGKTFGVEFYEMQKQVGNNILIRRTSKQTEKREPIWQDEGRWYTEAEFLAKKGMLPLAPTYIINSSTVINGSSRPINDGSKITFTLDLKASACVNYATQIRDSSGSSTPVIFKDSGVKLEVTLNAKTGMYISIKATEKYNVTVKGMNTDLFLNGTEKFSNFVKKPV